MILIFLYFHTGLRRENVRARTVSVPVHDYDLQWLIDGTATNRCTTCKIPKKIEIHVAARTLKYMSFLPLYFVHYELYGVIFTHIMILGEPCAKFAALDKVCAHGLLIPPKIRRSARILKRPVNSSRTARQTAYLQSFIFGSAAPPFRTSLTHLSTLHFPLRLSSTIC